MEVVYTKLGCHMLLQQTTLLHASWMCSQNATTALWSLTATIQFIFPAQVTGCFRITTIFAGGVCA